MRRVALCIAAVVTAALPARAGRILYATANSQDDAGANRVDGFCVGDGGGLAPTKTVSVQTNGILPRRLLVGQSPLGGSVLYVAERDRVEVYSIRPAGGLQRIGNTKVIDQMIPRDIVLSADARTLYVPQPQRDRVLAYPLKSDGAPREFDDDGQPKDPTDDSPQADGTTQNRPLTCVQGQAGSKYDNVLTNGNKLYVSAPGTNRVDIYALKSDGTILSLVTDANGDPGPTLSGKNCFKGVRDTPVTEVLSTRTQLQGARSLLFNGNVLFVEERFIKRISSFDFSQTNGVFCNHAKDDPVTCYPKPQQNAMKNKFQQPRGRTAIGFGYDALLIVPAVPVAASSPPPAASTIYGTQFFHGRIDAFKLPADGMLPMKPKKPLKARIKTDEDLRTSPVRFVATDDTLYVAAGSLDRIQAYRIRTDNGMLKSTDVFSRTDEQKGSFPNDVAIAVLSGDCR